jgi:glycosyltransferase involved in cell wall biosynthesis
MTISPGARAPDRRLRVLFITAWYPSGAAPYEGVFVREHALAVARFDEVAVLHCPEPRRSLPRLWEVETETDPALTAGLPTVRAWYRPARVPKTSLAVHLVAIGQALRAVYRAGFRPDLLHAHVYDAGFATALFSKWLRLPYVVTEHFSAFPRHTLPPGEIRKARIAFEQAAWVLPVSRALQAGIEQHGIRGRFQIVGNVVDNALFYPGPARSPNDPLRIVSVGSLVPIKGIPDLLHALSRLQETPLRWRLDVIGDGPQRAAYAVLAAELGLAGQVAFHGTRPKADVAAFLRQADLFVLASQWENMPCVLLEAQASGVPIVASAVGGIPEIVDDAVGILVPPGDAPALAAALAAALTEPGRFDRRLMVERAAASSPAAIGQKLDSIYRSVLTR